MLSNITSKGQVTIPAALRRKLRMQPGGKVRFVPKGKQVLLEAVQEEPIDTLFGLLRAPKGRSIPDGANIHQLAAKGRVAKFRQMNREWRAGRKK